MISWRISIGEALLIKGRLHKFDEEGLGEGAITPWWRTFNEYKENLSALQPEDIQHVSSEQHDYWKKLVQDQFCGISSQRVVVKRVKQPG